jgi:glutaredoxin
MEKITIYTQGNCGYCKTVKDALSKENIEFEEKLINEHPNDWKIVTSLTNMPTTPTIYYNYNYFIPARDFGNPQQLINILKEFKESEFTESRQALEKIKTLNYNMSGAFNRMEQLLMKIETKLNTKDEHKSTS